MAYLNLLHRERADLSADEAGYKKDVEVADKWMSKALETRKVKAEASSQEVWLAELPKATDRSNPID